MLDLPLFVTLYFSESPESPSQTYLDTLPEVVPTDLPEKGSRKARIAKCKKKLKRHKSSLRASRTAPISSAVDHISPSLINNAEGNVIMRTASDLPSQTR